MRNFRLGAYLQTGEEPGLNSGFLGGVGGSVDFGGGKEDTSTVVA